MSGLSSGAEMWRDYTASYGVITALVICHRYLDLQARTTDESERAFCRELREAMTMERNYRDAEVYLHSDALAKYNCETELFDESDRLNRLCAGDIDNAIHAVEYGDGTHDYKSALAALTEQYSTERVNIVLAAEAKWLGFMGQLPDDAYQWARGFNLGDHFYGGFHLRTRPNLLGEFIAYMREAAEHEKNMEVKPMSNKTIRFIDSDYKELFRIPDGGSIKITYPPGDDRGTVTRQCKYLDEMHVEISRNGSYRNTYHVCEWAERMEAIGARYEPEAQLRGMELTSFTPGDEKFYTYNREEGNTCVGHISGDFGNSGDRYFSSWYNHETKAEQDWNNISPEFQGELHSAVYALRYQYNFLTDYGSMRALCDACPEAMLDSGDNYQRYGFKLETDTRQYYTQCFFGENMRDARFIVYAYDKAAAREQERPAGDKASVLKQIRDAEKAPKPPRKAKAPGKKKDGAEL